MAAAVATCNFQSVSGRVQAKKRGWKQLKRASVVRNSAVQTPVGTTDRTQLGKSGETPLSLAQRSLNGTIICQAGSSRARDIIGLPDWSIHQRPPPLPACRQVVQAWRSPPWGWEPGRGAIAAGTGRTSWTSHPIGRWAQQASVLPGLNGAVHHVACGCPAARDPAAPHPAAPAAACCRLTRQ